MLPPVILSLCLFVSCNGNNSPIGDNLFKHKLNPSLQVEKINTPLEEDKIFFFLTEAHESVIGKKISKKKLAASWAHIALENNRGKSVWNYNFGNLGPLTSDQKYYNHKGRGGWPYRSFDSFLEGAKAYWEVIKKCQPAYQFFEIGFPADAARGLKMCNYFQSSLEEYSKIFSMLYNEAYFKLIPKHEEGRESSKY